MIFQPHLFSRTRDFAEDFGVSLAKFDEVNLLEVYPARELPISGIDAHFLLEIDNSNKKIIEKSEIRQVLDTAKNAVVVLLGAGDIGVEAHKISKYFNETV